MSGPIVVIDSSEVREGKLEELKTALKELAAFVEADEADPIAYNIYFDEDCTQMTVVPIHPSSASMELHMFVLPDDAAMGPVWGGNIGEGRAKSGEPDVRR